MTELKNEGEREGESNRCIYDSNSIHLGAVIAQSHKVFT